MLRSNALRALHRRRLLVGVDSKREGVWAMSIASVELAVIIVSYCNADDVDRCLRSLARIGMSLTSSFAKMAGEQPTGDYWLRSWDRIERCNELPMRRTLLTSHRKDWPQWLNADFKIARMSSELGSRPRTSVTEAASTRGLSHYSASPAGVQCLSLTPIPKWMAAACPN